MINDVRIIFYVDTNNLCILLSKFYRAKPNNILNCLIITNEEVA